MNPAFWPSALVVTLTAMLGCAAQSSGPTADEVLAADPSLACFNRMDGSPEMVFLRDKGFGSAPDLTSLANRTKMSTGDAWAIEAYGRRRQTCIDAGAQYRASNFVAPVSTAYSRFYSRGTIALSRLYAGDISYGEYHESRIENVDRLDADLAAFRSVVEQRNAQLEAEKRASQMNALQQIQVRKPVQTTCTRTAYQLNCSSY